jgi:hypothetical protein
MKSEEKRKKKLMKKQAKLIAKQLRLTFKAVAVARELMKPVPKFPSGGRVADLTKGGIVPGSGKVVKEGDKRSASFTFDASKLSEAAIEGLKKLQETPIDIKFYKPQK